MSQRETDPSLSLWALNFHAKPGYRFQQSLPELRISTTFQVQHNRPPSVSRFVGLVKRNIRRHDDGVVRLISVRLERLPSVPVPK